MGFTQELRPNFEFFLSCGIPGEMEGERYKKSQELVLQTVNHMHQDGSALPIYYLEAVG